MRQCTSDCIVIEDAGAGVIAAQAARMRVIGISGDSLGDANAVDAVVADLSEVRVIKSPGSASFCLQLASQK
jgi:beta-phosphoglucomutase-like phosphatase (HAD superfamily)